MSIACVSIALPAGPSRSWCACASGPNTASVAKIRVLPEWLKPMLSINAGVDIWIWSQWPFLTWNWLAGYVHVRSQSTFTLRWCNCRALFSRSEPLQARPSLSSVHVREWGIMFGGCDTTWAIRCCFSCFTVWRSIGFDQAAGTTLRRLGVAKHAACHRVGRHGSGEVPRCPNVVLAVLIAV